MGEIDTAIKYFEDIKQCGRLRVIQDLEELGIKDPKKVVEHLLWAGIIVETAYTYAYLPWYRTVKTEVFKGGRRPQSSLRAPKINFQVCEFCGCRFFRKKELNYHREAFPNGSCIDEMKRRAMRG